MISQPHPKIKVYDNVFDWTSQEVLYQKCFLAPYELGWADSPFQKDYYMHCRITSDMWQNAANTDERLHDFLQILTGSEPYKSFEGKGLDKTVINCDTIADSHTCHAHQGQDVILYYANIEWKEEWSGETLFYDHTRKNIICSVPYTPNRMVVFDGELLHRYNAPSASGPKYRFSVSSFFWKE